MHFTLVIHEFAVCACLAQHELLREAVEDLTDMAGPTSWVENRSVNSMMVRGNGLSISAELTKRLD